MPPTEASRRFYIVEQSEDFRWPVDVLPLYRWQGSAMAVDPRGSDLKRLLAEDPGGPVVMLNLLRFKPGGRATYEKYLRHLTQIVTAFGGEIVYLGEGSTVLVAEAGQAWDAVLLVRYPTRATFSRMVADPQYQKITGLRTSSLTEAVLQATVPGNL